MKVVCDNYGLLQLVREPTRQQYLLDLFLSDIPGTKIKVGPYIADHKFVLASIPMPEVQTKVIERYDFKIGKADWKGLKKALKETRWDDLQKGSAEDTFIFFMESL